MESEFNLSKLVERERQVLQIHYGLNLYRNINTIVIIPSSTENYSRTLS